MSSALEGTVLNAGKAIGLLGSNGSLDSGWFDEPGKRVGQILSNTTQRDAFLDLLDELIPGDAVAGPSPGEEWHPLLGENPRGNVYLTIKPSGGGNLIVGVAGNFRTAGSTTAPLAASISAQLPIVKLNLSNPQPIAGTAEGPLTVNARIYLGWTRPAEAIALKAVTVRLRLSPVGNSPSPFGIEILLEGLDIDGAGPKDRLLNPDNLDDQAMDLILGLVQQKLSELTSPGAFDAPFSDASSTADHLLPLLGFGNSGGIPPLPIKDLLSSPAAFQTWLNQIIAAGKMKQWIGHLAALFGSSDPVAGTGTLADPWSASITSIGPNQSKLYLIFAHASQKLHVGVRLSLSPSSDASKSLDAQVNIIGIPLSGAGNAAILPLASLLFRAGTAAAPLVSSGAGGVSVETLQAGLAWDGTRLTPRLELLDVDFNSLHYEALDLTNTDSVAAAGEAALRAALDSVLGDSPVAASLLALTGLAKPSGDTAWPHLANIEQLLTKPSQAIAKVHRDALLNTPQHGWQHLFAEVAKLMGLAGPVQGSGTQTDPWRVALASAGQVTVSLAAWNAQTVSGTSEVQKLRIGLSLNAGTPPWGLACLAEALAFDLPLAGSGDVRLIGSVHAALTLNPGFASPESNGISVAVGSLGFFADWIVGAPLRIRGTISNLAVTAEGNTVTIPEFSYPSAVPFDISNPGAALSIDHAQLRSLLSVLVARASVTWAGMPGLAVTGLLGLHDKLNGLPSGWPTLGAGLPPSTLFTDPLAALRKWALDISTGVAPGGTPLLPAVLPWLRGLLENQLPSATELPLPIPTINGYGIYDAPWSFPVVATGDRAVDLLAWLEPAGPPANWATASQTLINASTTFGNMIDAERPLGAYSEALRAAFDGVDTTAIAERLEALALEFENSDGVVSLESQSPAHASWTVGTALHCAHHKIPSDPSAISQTLAKLGQWFPGASQRAVLVIGPAFADRTAWNALLAAANAAKPGSSVAGAHFNLRVPNTNPLSIDLAPVAIVSDFYTADLQDDGVGNHELIAQQIGRVVERIRQIKPGLKVAIVAHSTAGVAARLFAAANPSLVQGVLTLGTPHLGSALYPLRDEGLASALRFIQPFVPALAASPFKDALGHLFEALDGYAPPPTAGALPVPVPYPVLSFSAPGDLEMNGVLAHAIGSVLEQEFFQVVRNAFSATAASLAASVGPTPTHLAFGVRAALDVPVSAPGQISVDATIRVDASRFALSSGAPEPVRPKHAVTASAHVARPGGWLAGTPQSFLGESADIGGVRVRSADLGVTIVSNGGTPSVTPFARLNQVAYHGPSLPQTGIGSPILEPLLGEVFRALAGPESLPGSPAALLLEAFDALGLAVPTPAGIPALSADAFAAIQVDAPAFLAPKLPFALSLPGGFLGFEGTGTGPWTYPLAGGKVEAYIEKNGTWRVGLRTVGDEPLTIAGDLSAKFDASVTVPAFEPQFDATVKLSEIALQYTQSTETLVLHASPWVDSLTLLPPPSSAVLKDVLSDLIPRLLMSSAVASLLEGIPVPSLFDGGPVSQFPLANLGAIDKYLARPAEILKRPELLGDGEKLSATRINEFFDLLRDTLELGDGPGIPLPAGLRITASESPETTINLDATTPIGGVLGLHLQTAIDAQLHPTPSGQVTLNLALAGGAWGTLGVAFGLLPSGPTLSLQPGAGTPIQILPAFSGLSSLVSGGAGLLPLVLDQVHASFGLTPPQIVTLATNVASSLGLADTGSAQPFSSRSEQWREVLQGDWLSSFSAAGARQNVLNALHALTTNAASPLSQLPGGFALESQTLRWQFQPPAGAGNIAVHFGWDGGGPAFRLSAQGYKLPNGPLVLDLAGGRANGQIKAEAALGIDLQPALGVPLAPGFSFGLNGVGLKSSIYPLGKAQASTFEIQLLPTAQVKGNANAPLEFTRNLVVPLVAGLLVDAAQAKLTLPLWTGGPALRDVLKSGGILNAAYQLATAFPQVDQLITGLLAGLVKNGVNLAITPKLNFQLVSDTSQPGKTRLGFGVNGSQTFTVRGIDITMHFGDAGWIDDTVKGAAVYLFERQGQGAFTFNPILHIAGLGLGLAGENGSPLLNNNFIRLGAVSGYLFFDLAFKNGISATGFGAGVELTEFGLPLGQALGGLDSTSNPVAASLLQSDGSGDPAPVNPAVDVVFAYRNANKIIFEIGGQTGPFWFGVRRSFGPIYIEQIGLEQRENRKKVALMVDGKVEISGLTIAVDDLSVIIPIRDITTPSEWGLDLRGLAVGYKNSGVSIAGGLVKNPGPPISYDGMLQVDIAGKGFTAVGSYARPTDQLGEYTSLFIFVAVPIPLGGPPAFFVLGLGGGAGYNRQLIVPTEITQVPNFLLVSAINNPTFANDPMRALRDMAVSIPPKRGSFWLAAGIKFSSFVIVNTTAVLYVAIDRGFEVGILGVSRMALPSADFAIASVELALKARYNSTEGILSIQAQLTENSYLFHPSCQLTGGFAFFIWFPQGQFLLTLGGYHPAFQKRPEYPDVPRLGFKWVMGPVTVKGGAYFALTNTCVMAGGRLEAVFKAGPIRAWFTAYTDILISWDPFHYDIRIGVQVGLAVEVEVCFIGCATIRMSLTRGASVKIIGPPFYAEVTVDAYITDITIPFGKKPSNKPNYITDFNVFKKKYLTAGDNTGAAVGLKFASGMLPPEPPGAQPSPGSQSQPWKVGVEFSFVTETRMPASTFAWFLGSNPTKPSGASDVDLAPMGKQNVTSTHRIRIFRGTTSNTPATSTNHFSIAPTIGLFPEATWNFVDPKKVKAASNTIPAISGLTVTGTAFLVGQSQEIKIVGVVDDLPDRAQPLPFATNTAQKRAEMIAYGQAAAQVFTTTIVNATAKQMLNAAEKILTDLGPMADIRSAAGIPVAGIQPVAKHALRYKRSAPPMVLPLTTGLTMENVGLTTPPAYQRVGEKLPVFLKEPRLVAVLQRRPKPVEDSLGRIHTTVTNVEHRGVSRRSPPRMVLVPVARLQKIAALHAPRPTSAAVAPRVLHNMETGVANAPAHAQFFKMAVEQVRSKGVRIPAGTSHVWQLPQRDEATAFAVAGNAACRVTLLDRTGAPVADFEFAAEKEIAVLAPPAAETVVFTCLGRATQLRPPAPAAITYTAAAAAGLAVVGWESAYVGELVSSSTLLVRGGLLIVPRPAAALHRNQDVVQSAVRAAEIVKEQVAVETWLPIAVGSVLILLDGIDPTSATLGDLAIAVEGGTLVTPPINVGGGRRRGLLYDVASRDKSVQHLKVSVGSNRGWQVAGVIGLEGKALEWVNRFHGDVPEHLVDDLPLTPDGAITVRLTTAPAPRTAPESPPNVPRILSDAAAKPKAKKKTTSKKRQEKR